MDHCCFDCPVTNCTVRELLHHIDSNNNYYSYNNGASTAAVALGGILSVLFYIMITAIILIVMSLLFYHKIYKKKCRHHKNQSDSRLDQQNEENISRGGAEGITYDVIDNKAQVTAPEMKQNEAYAGGLTSTGQK